MNWFLHLFLKKNQKRIGCYIGQISRISGRGAYIENPQLRQDGNEIPIDLLGHVLSINIVTRIRLVSQKEKKKNRIV